jgi:NAD(P)H dehydrogenase (quinone)
MRSVAIAFHTVTGTTEQLAHAVARGVAESGCAARLVAIEGCDIVEGRYRGVRALEMVEQSDAVIFGAPTYMGGPSAQFKAFADATSDRWEAQAWHGKLAAGFTVGTSANGDQSSTLQYFFTLASQHGMIWVSLNVPCASSTSGPNRLGVQVGASAQSEGTSVVAADLHTAFLLGKRVGQLVAKGMSGT